MVDPTIPRFTRIRRVRSLVRPARRTTVYLCAAALAAALTVVAGQTSNALACSTSSHCYAQAVANGPANHGGYGELSDNCLYMPNNGNFVTQEIWDASTNTAAYWTEVGLISGSFDGSYYSHQWFWADNRPGGGFHFHATGGTASGGPLPVETTYIGNSEWDIYGGNSFALLGTSTSQPASSSGFSQFGTEYTVNPGSGMRDVGTIYSLEWESTGGTWNSEGGLAHAVYGGPGPYSVTPTYNASGSYLGMSGPC